MEKYEKMQFTYNNIHFSKNMNFKFKHLIIYIISVILYITYVLSNRRDYHDLWILQDILIPTIIFIFLFISIVILNNDNRIIALICSSFIFVINSIPAIKYEFFYGIADTTFHYRFINEIINSGYVPSGVAYSGVPGMQILISLFSIVPGILLNYAFKYTMPITFGIYPLIIYFVSNKLIQNYTLKKYVIIASAIPIITVYYLIGTIFPLLFLILLGPIVIISGIEEKNKIRYRVILIIMLLAILISHTVTSLLFITFSSISIILLILYGRIKKLKFALLIKNLYVMIIFSSILFIFWWMYESGYLFSIFAKTSYNTVQHFLIDIQFRKEPIPQRFFSIPLIEKLKILAVFHIKDMILAFLTMVGIIHFFGRMKKMDKEYAIFNIYLVSFLAAIIFVLGIEFLIKFGDLEYYRFINYGIIFTPFFIGLSFCKLNVKITKKIFDILFIFIIITISLIEFFPYQALVPSANIIDKNITDGEPLMYFNHVNSIYQRDMISFASNFSSNKSIITTDTITRLQTISFFNMSFSDIVSNDSNILWDDPLLPEKERRWNLFLLHWNGKSGAFREQAENRSNDKISINRNQRNVIYDNGESFIIQRNLEK